MLLATAVLLSAGTALAAKHDTTLVSRIGLAGAGADGDSWGTYGHALSADGRYVAFVSGADNLNADSNDAVTNVFVKDMLTGDVAFASRATGAAGAVEDMGTNDPVSISDDGTSVVFTSPSDVLSPDDNNAHPNVFLRNIVTNTTTLVSRETGAAGTGGDASSGNAVVSANGRYVVFDSEADNLSAADNNLVSNLFMRDLVSNTTTLVSVTTGGAALDGASIGPASISADGRFVAFQSGATNISASDNDSTEDIYLRDTVAGTTTWVSKSSLGAAGDENSTDPNMSADGRYVAFQSDADFLHDEDGNNTIDIFVHDTLTGTLTLASRLSGSGAAGDNDSRQPAISGDGRLVAFHSTADNLSTEDDNTATNLFLRDLVSGETTLIGRSSGIAGTIGAGGAQYPSISSDGQFVSFESGDNTISSEDTTSFDVFLRQVREKPINLTVPAIAGTVRVGKTVSCSDGTWSGSPTSFTRIWERAGTPISGATAATYKLTTTDTGLQLTCVVTATNSDGSATATSAGSTVLEKFCGRIQHGNGRNNKLTGTSGSDALFGLGGNDLLKGLSGDDCLYGGKGNDKILGAAGADIVDGGKGNDNIDGGSGADNLNGGRGNDRIKGGKGADTINAGAGKDTINTARDGSIDIVKCGPGRDHATVDKKDKVSGCERVTRVGKAAPITLEP